MKRLSGLALGVSALGVAGMLLAGCSHATPRQTSVTEVPQAEETTGALTPLQRGEVRRDVLRASREAMDAWKRNDVAGMRSTLATDMAGFFAKTLADYDKAGKVRVRKYRDIAPLEVIDMNATGSQALATWEFYDDSYVADKKTGKPLTKPTGADTSLQLTVEKHDGRWIVVRIIGGDAVLK